MRQDWPIFERTVFGRLPSEQIAVDGFRPPVRASRRLHRIESMLAEMSALHLGLPPASWMSIRGADVDVCAAIVWAEAESESQADSVAEHAELRHDADIFRLHWRNIAAPGALTFRWDVVAPTQCAVTIHGADAVVGVYDIAGPVSLSVGGHIAVIGSTGVVNAKSVGGGDVVWAGRRGNVTIASDSVALRVTDRVFEGSLQATSVNELRLLIPDGFEAGIEAEAAEATALVCGDGLSSPAGRHEPGRVVQELGSGPLRLHLRSLTGRILIERAEPDDWPR